MTRANISRHFLFTSRLCAVGHSSRDHRSATFTKRSHMILWGVPRIICYKMLPGTLNMHFKYTAYTFYYQSRPVQSMAPELLYNQLKTTTATATTTKKKGTWMNIKMSSHTREAH